MLFRSGSTLGIEYQLDTRILDRDIEGFKELSTADVRLCIAATAQVSPDLAGEPISGSVKLYTESELSVQLIREPELRIVAINLVKYELINVILEVVLEVSNPNAFPLEFDKLTHDFFGEGKRWARGQANKTLQIPANGSASTKIPVLLNFTDMDRRVFDLVEKLQVVNYQLNGTATVRTGLDFLPVFTMDFKRSGGVKVAQTRSGK